MGYQRLKMLVRLVSCALILTAIAVQRNGSVLGHDITAPEASGSESDEAVTVNDGVTTINTTSIGGDIKGYGGPTPLVISIKDGKISDITALRNAESEDFFAKVRDKLIPEWIGTAVDDVAAKQVDAVSGATLSSNAVNATIKSAVAYAHDNLPVSAATADIASAFTPKRIAALAVVLLAAILPLFIRSKRYRYIQLALNVIVLGFWCGTFLSYEVFVNYLANGANLAQSAVVLLMLVIAFVYPYFGRPNHYCTWVCPLGSLQELAGKTTKSKLKLSPGTLKGLTIFRECLWYGLMFVMCAAIWSGWMNWELFTAFIFNNAAPGVLIAAILFVLLSVVVSRPYCRFVCPTGYLFQTTQNPDKQ